MSDEPYDWSDVERGYEPPEGGDGLVHTAVTPEERGEVRLADFWKARPALAHIHDFARARRAGPWAVLGSVLARVVAATPPQVQLPPTIGSYASINLFVGLIGKSGRGKDIARRVAADAIDLGETTFMTAPLGSGEGLSHMYMRSPGRGSTQPEQYNTSALVIVGEIDTFSALATRNSTTLPSQLRQAAMGEQLGFFYVDTTKRMLVPEHAYRMALIAGIQPERAGILLNDADGGTPQRFIWLPAGDPQAPDEPPPEPAPLAWVRPNWVLAPRAAGTVVRVEVGLPTVAREAIVAARLANLREQLDALDSHALLTRTKVATALTILDGRYVVDDEDWSLSGTIMAVSDAHRAACQRAMKTVQEKQNVAQAHSEAERVIIVADRVGEDRLRRVVRTLRRRLERVGPETPGRLKNALASQDREFFDTAIEAMINEGNVALRDGRYVLI